MGPLREVLRILYDEDDPRFPVATELKGCGHVLEFGSTTSSKVRLKIQARHCTKCPPEAPRERRPRGAGRVRRPRGEGGGGGNGLPGVRVGWGMDELLRPAPPRPVDRRPPIRVVEVSEGEQQALEAAAELFRTADGTVERQLVLERLERSLTRAGRLRLETVDGVQGRAAMGGRRR